MRVRIGEPCPGMNELPAGYYTNADGDTIYRCSFCDRQFLTTQLIRTLYAPVHPVWLLGKR